ncbi:MAG: hypothetical protein O3A00_05455 [Planctomycetota bacterium]|nr:hypothetical protein [Planctomycetota bacterium]
MNCTKFDRQLCEAVEVRESLEPRVAEPRSIESARLDTLRTHAEQCAQCRRKWDEFELINRLISIWKPQVPEVDLADAVLFAVANDVTNELDRTSHRTVRLGFANLVSGRSQRAVLAVVALAGIVLAVLSIVANRPIDPPQGDALAKHDASHVASESRLRAISSSPPIGELLSDASAAYQLVASDTATLVQDGVSLFRPAAVEANQLPVEAESPMVLRNLADTIPGRIEQFGQGLKPIGSGVKSATGFLFKVLPFQESPAT